MSLSESCHIMYQTELASWGQRWFSVLTLSSDRTSKKMNKLILAVKGGKKEINRVR